MNDLRSFFAFLGTAKDARYVVSSIVHTICLTAMTHLAILARDDKTTVNAGSALFIEYLLQSQWIATCSTDQIIGDI